MSSTSVIDSNAKMATIRLIRSHPEGLFRLYKSDYVVSHKMALLRDCEVVHSRFVAAFPGTNSTATTNAAEALKYKNHEGYLLYNIFSLAAPSPHFYELFCNLINVIRDFTSEKRLYMQAWLNYQSSDEVLGWHSHEGYKYHGYISIDPKSTVTEFEGYHINNNVGQIYIGSAFTRHRVVNDAKFRGKRVTIGFDLIEPMDCVVSNRGFIPLVL